MAAHTHVRQTKHEVCEVTAGGKKTQESSKTKRKDDRRHNNTKCKKGRGSLSYEQDTQEAAVPCEHSTVCSEHRHQTDETDERCSC